MSTSLLVIAIAAMNAVYGCTCSDPTVQDARQHATVVFRGTIVTLRQASSREALPAGWPGDTGKIAVFRVGRVWKGKVGQTFEMPALHAMADCWGFSQEFLKVGAELIVYALKSEGLYQTGLCSRTRFLKYAGRDIKELGTGAEPPLASSPPNSKYPATK
jgi:hypothetical protein